MDPALTLVKLLIALHLVWAGPAEGKREYVGSGGETVEIADGPATAPGVRVLVIKEATTHGPQNRWKLYYRAVEGGGVRVYASEEAARGGGTEPPVTAAAARRPGMEFALHTGERVSVLRVAAGVAVVLGGCPYAEAEVGLLRIGARAFRVIRAGDGGLAGLEEVTFPAGAEVTDASLARDALPRAGWIYRVQPARSCGPQAEVHPLLDLAVDTAGRASLPWRGGALGIDSAALDAEGRAAAELEERAQKILRAEPDDLLLHLETLRRLAVYLSTVGGKPLASDARALARMRDAARDFGMATLYGKVEKGPLPSFYFDLGIMLEAFHECGLRDDWDPLPFLQQAARSDPENPVLYVGLGLVYEGKGLPERAAEYRHWARRLASAPAPLHDRLERALRGARDEASWSQYGKYLEECADRARGPMRVRVTTRDGRVLAGDLLDVGSRTYRVRVGDDVVEVAEGDVRKIVFGE